MSQTYTDANEKTKNCAPKPLSANFTFVSLTRVRQVVQTCMGDYVELDLDVNPTSPDLRSSGQLLGHENSALQFILSGSGVDCAGVVESDISTSVPGSEIAILSQNSTRLTFQVILGADASALTVSVSYGLTCDSDEKFTVSKDFSLVVIQTVELDFDAATKTRSFSIPATKCASSVANFKGGNISELTCASGVCTFNENYSIVAL